MCVQPVSGKAYSHEVDRAGELSDGGALAGQRPQPSKENDDRYARIQELSAHRTGGLPAPA